MGLITGDRTVDIGAPIERVFAIAANIEAAPAWQASLRVVDVETRYADGRPELVDTASDAKIRTIRTRLRFSYEEPTGIRWVQEKGELKALTGWWTLEALADDRTRATYALAVDPGRILGLLLRGPVEGQVRDFLLGHAAEGLKRQAETGV